MSSCTGTFQECLLYAKNFNLPITYIIENNGKSVCTNTYKVWNTTKLTNEPEYEINKVIKVSFHLWYYWYNLDKWPHAGSGIRCTILIWESIKKNFAKQWNGWDNNQILSSLDRQ